MVMVMRISMSLQSSGVFSWYQQLATMRKVIRFPAYANQIEETSKKVFFSSFSFCIHTCINKLMVAAETCAKLNPFGCAPLFVYSMSIEFNPLEIIFLEIGLNTVCFRYIGQIKLIFRSLSTWISSFLCKLKLFIVSKNSINNVQRRVLQRNPKNSKRRILKFRSKEGYFKGVIERFGMKKINKIV